MNKIFNIIAVDNFKRIWLQRMTSNDFNTNTELRLTFNKLKIVYYAQ